MNEGELPASPGAADRRKPAGQIEPEEQARRGVSAARQPVQQRLLALPASPCPAPPDAPDTDGVAPRRGPAGRQPGKTRRCTC